MLHRTKLGAATYVVLIALFCLICAYTLYLDDHFSTVRKNVKRRILTVDEKPTHVQTSFMESASGDNKNSTNGGYCSHSTEILKRLRSLMRDHVHVPVPLDAYIVLYQDAHQNDEFLADKDRRIRFLSGFTGEYGTIIVTKEHAYLRTNYGNAVQADTDVDENWTVMIEDDPNVPSLGSWLETTLPEGSKIGFHSFTMPYQKWKTLSNAIQDRRQTLVPVDENLVDLIGPSQTLVSEKPIFPLELYYSGETAKSKIEKLHSKMLANGVTVCLIQSLEEIAWLLNMRGSDIPYVPVFFAYLVITSTVVHLFLGEATSTTVVRDHLAQEKLNFVIHLYKDVLPVFTNIVNSDAQNKVWLPPDTSYAFVSVVVEQNLLFEHLPIALMKAIKNDVEIEGFVNAHIRDAAALCCFFAWLEKELSREDSTVTELTAVQRLDKYRRQQLNYIGESFPTISASGEHAAILHYDVTPETDRPLSTNELYLCDSGAHYMDGTTDVTRTLHFGTPSDYEKECFTRVLKGHIQLRTSTFPENTRGNVLDAFARKYLWDAGLEYFHGTGHGIGTLLNVHESPIDVSKKADPRAAGLLENMLLSNEPGYYEDGKFGIRIENILRTIRVQTRYGNRYLKFLTFEDLTMVPIQTSSLLNIAMLTRNEIQYINEYHTKCRRNVAPLLQAQGEIDGLAWLMKQTEPL